MAANTAFADFPRLAALQAGDGFLPRQLTFRGSRLVFSRGIVVLALIASLIIVAFRASVINIGAEGQIILGALTATWFALAFRAWPGWLLLPATLLVSFFGGAAWGLVPGLPAHVLRFWETEFKRINPKRTASGQRLYRKSDVELIMGIKHLLYEKKFTIQGARQHLKTLAPQINPKHHRFEQLLTEIREELIAIRKILG